jgi:hypothetical protein
MARPWRKYKLQTLILGSSRARHRAWGRPMQSVEASGALTLEQLVTSISEERLAISKGAAG